MRRKDALFIYQRIAHFNQKYPAFTCTPLDEFCDDNGINLIPYNDNNKEVAHLSQDGFSLFDHGEYSIFYHEKRPRTRRHFTIAHEIGHIALGHHTLVSPSMLRYGGDGIWEQHANIFARNILVPLHFERLVTTMPTLEAAWMFRVSYDMMQIRKKFFAEDGYWLERI